MSPFVIVNPQLVPNFPELVPKVSPIRVDYIFCENVSLLFFFVELCHNLYHFIKFLNVFLAPLFVFQEELGVQFSVLAFCGDPDICKTELHLFDVCVVHSMQILWNILVNNVIDDLSADSVLTEVQLILGRQMFDFDQGRDHLGHFLDVELGQDFTAFEERYDDLILAGFVFFLLGNFRQGEHDDCLKHRLCCVCFELLCLVLGALNHQAAGDFQQRNYEIILHEVGCFLAHLRLILEYLLFQIVLIFSLK